MLTKLMKVVILLLMGINGSFYLAWFLSAGPDRVGYWYLIYFLLFPLLALLGLAALITHQNLKLSKWVGGTVLIYVGSLTVLLTGSGLGLLKFMDGLPQNSFEILHAIAWFIALISLLWAMGRHSSLAARQ
jgi:hypothetical protein